MIKPPAPELSTGLGRRADDQRRTGGDPLAVMGAPATSPIAATAAAARTTEAAPTEEPSPAPAATLIIPERWRHPRPRLGDHAISAFESSAAALWVPASQHSHPGSSAEHLEESHSPRQPSTAMSWPPPSDVRPAAHTGHDVERRSAQRRGERCASPLTLAALPTETSSPSQSVPPTPSLPEISTEPLTTDSPQTRREGWWRRAHAALRSAPENSQTTAAPGLLPRLRRPLAPASAPYVVSAVSLKGGVGKTTVAACLGLALSRHRADRVLAADLNLHAGTLNERLLHGAPHQTVQHLLDDLLDDGTPISAVGDIDRYLGIADRLSILAGHKDPSIGAAFAEDDVAELMTCLGRFFHIVIADCGTGVADEAMQAVLRETDTLVLVATPTPDAAGLAEETLTWLEDHGYARLVQNSIAVLSGSASGNRPGPQWRFQDRCRAVIDIPPDTSLARGRVITLDALAEDTHHAYLALAAAVMDAAPEGRCAP